jgi:hypothetical protein
MQAYTVGVSMNLFTPPVVWPTYRYLPPRLAKARNAVGIAEADIDRALNLPLGTCASWEAGKSIIDPYALEQFATVTKMPVEWLLRSGKQPKPAGPPIHTVQDALGAAGPKVGKTTKKNWSEAFSRALAVMFANHLRADFPGVNPDEHGRRQERPARTNRGYKKLDVGYSTEELGLALGVSIKSINFRDEKTKRYTKNYSRNDNELRAEAMDYHRRQPFAVLVGVLMLPVDSCDDAGADESSFAAAVRYFRKRCGRHAPDGDADLFEAFFIGLYDDSDPSGSNDLFFDVNDPPPKSGRPRRRPYPIDVVPPEYLDLSLAEVVVKIRSNYDAVNSYPFDYAR